MKNKDLIMLLAAFVGGINANDDAGQLTVALAQTGVQLYAADQNHQQSLPNEKNFRRELYWLDKNNPLFYKLDGFQKNFDYYIAVLTEHIKTLEGKIALKQNGLKSRGMRSGAIASGLSALCGYGSYYLYMMGKSVKALGPKQLIRSQEAMNNAVMCGILSTLFAGIAANQFHKVYRYAERLVERLERDKRILAVLEKEKSAQYTSKLNSVVTQEAVLKVIEAVMGAIDSVVKSKTA